MSNRTITIVGTKGENPGIKNGEIGEYEVLDKDSLIERMKELTDEGYGYTILIADDKEI